MRIDPLVLIRRFSEFVTLMHGLALTFAFRGPEVGKYRRSVPHPSLISVVDGSTLNWCVRNVLREAVSEGILFGRIAEPEMAAINFNNCFRT